eukprot:TRINITY_DN38337_c0_g5_i1.p1 TRINITY_DN38337_c0_g5~~TRINITY_DN38337_c0_g5_i1.p1  ORF type:complete len:1571 (+),score=403.77 TRINITY_DN38337_c0_g5_i1:187-4899(+)
MTVVDGVVEDAKTGRNNAIRGSFRRLTSTSTSGSELDSQAAPTRQVTQPKETPVQEDDVRLAALIAGENLLDKCGSCFIQRLVADAPRVHIAAGQAVHLQELGECWLVVQKGGLAVTVGNGVSKIWGAGATLNAPGLLGLKLREPSDPDHDPQPNPASETRTPSMRGGKHCNLPPGYEIEGYCTEAPRIYEDRCGELDTSEVWQNIYSQHEWERFDEDRRCYFGLCPHAAAVGDEELQLSASAQRARLKALGVSGYTTDSLRIAGAPVGEGPAADGVSGALPEGGCVLLKITNALVDDIFEKPRASTSDREFAMVFQANCMNRQRWFGAFDELCGSTLLPDCPLEVRWALAEQSSRESAGVDDVICREGEFETKDDVLVVEQGVASVHKKTASNVEKHIGKLRNSGVIGDLLLTGGGVSRPCTVRCKTRTTLVRIPGQGILKVLNAFPGCSEALGFRLQVVSNMIRERQPERAEVLASLQLFRGLSLMTVDAIAATGSNCVYYCGTIIVQEGSQEGRLLVLKYGRCNIETKACGAIAAMPAGNCCGERTLLRMAEEAGASCRVVSPIAITMEIPRPALEEIVKASPSAQKHFEEVRSAPIESRVRGFGVGLLKLFRNCKTEFLDSLVEGIRSNCYLPGMTLVLEGVEEEDPSMFVLTGGQVAACKGAKFIGEMSVGATFGELAMLGISKTRMVTVRAITYAMARELAASTFRAALQKYPEEEAKFQQSLDYRGTQQSSKVEVSTFPWLTEMPKRVNYLLDLYKEDRYPPPGEHFEEIEMATFVVCKGSITIECVDSGRTLVVRERQTYNEEVLLGAKRDERIRCIPSEGTKLCVLLKAAFNKVLTEFEEQREKVLKILGLSVAQRLLEQNGLQSKVDVLKGSALFRACSLEFCEAIQAQMRSRIYDKGADIAGGDLMGEDCVFFMIDGEAKSVDQEVLMTLRPGEVFGESNMLGLTVQHPAVMICTKTSAALVLMQSDFYDMMESFPEDATLFGALTKAVNWRVVTSQFLEQKLQWTSALVRHSSDFIKPLASRVRLHFYAPSEHLFEKGESCELGQTCFYLILSGSVRVLGQAGVVYSNVQAGEVVGEAGAFGVVGHRTASIQAAQEGILCCAIVAGATIAAALRDNPKATDPISELLHKRDHSNEAAAKWREKWLKDHALPALAKCRLLAGCPRDLLAEISEKLVEGVFAADMVIAEMGTSSDSMIVLLQGDALVEARSGAKIGKLCKGAAFGEASILGLFPVRMATLRADTIVRVISLTQGALQTALSKPGREELKEGFERLVNSRYKQVATGVPLTKLRIGANADNTAVRSIALLSERIQLSHGQSLRPSGNDEPGAPYLGVLCAGRLAVGMREAKTPIMHIKPGGLIVEGLLAEVGAQLVAEGECECYRVRQSDFMMAVTSTPEAQEWFWNFKLLSKDTTAHAERMLRGVTALSEAQVQSPADVEIAAWKAKHCHQIGFAKALRRNRSSAAVHGKTGGGKFPPVKSGSTPNLSHVDGLSSVLQEGDSGLRLPVLSRAVSREGERRRGSNPGLRHTSKSNSSIDLVCSPGSRPTSRGSIATQNAWF